LYDQHGLIIERLNFLTRPVQNSRKPSRGSAGTIPVNSQSGLGRQSLKSQTFTPQEPGSSGIPIPVLEGGEGEAGDPGEACQAVAEENAEQGERENYAEVLGLFWFLVFAVAVLGFSSFSSLGS